MSRMYSVEFENVAVTAAQDFFEIAPVADKPVLLHSLYIAQVSDVGDAAEEMLRYRVIRGHTTSGSLGTVATPRPLNGHAGAAGFTAEVNNTTIASAGTAVNLHSDAFNIRAGLQMVWTPETRPLCKNADGVIVVRLLAAPLDSLTMAGTLYVAEL